MTVRELKAHQAAMAVLNDWPEILRTLDKEQGYIGLDLETSGLHFKRDRIAVVALYGPDTNTAGIIHLRGAAMPPELVDWLSSPRRSFITHNGTSFDIPYLAQYGVKYRQPCWYDTLIGEQVILTTDRKDVRVNLKDTLARRLKIAIPKNVDHATWMLPELDAEQMRYLADDIFFLPRLREAQLAKAQEQSDKPRPEGLPSVLDAMALEQRLAAVVATMTMRGLPIDLNRLNAYLEAQAAAVPEHKAWLNDRLGTDFNHNHAPSLKARLEERYGVPLMDTRADTLKTLAEEAEGEVAEACRRILAVRHSTKRTGMYDDEFLAKYVHQSRVYGGFVQCGTNTGRFASRSPNLQQLPRDMRHVFTDPTGELAYVAADYSAIEVRCAADLYGDDALLEALKAEDIHTSVASSLFGIPPEEVSKEQRRLAKAGSFNLTFGGGVRKLYDKARADGSTVTYAQIETFAAKFLGRFHGVDRARQRAYHKADMGRPVVLTLPTGLRRVLAPGADLKGTTILNTSVQSMAAAGLKHALLEADARGLSQYLSAVVHDEIVTTPPRELADEVGRELERAMLAGMAKVTDAPVAVEAKGGAAWG